MALVLGALSIDLRGLFLFFRCVASPTLFPFSTLFSALLKTNTSGNGGFGERGPEPLLLSHDKSTGVSHFFFFLNC